MIRQRWRNNNFILPSVYRCRTIYIDSAFNRNEYQESSWGQGAAGAQADNLTAIY
jgi:hypothetical protein